MSGRVSKQNRPALWHGSRVRESLPSDQPAAQTSPPPPPGDITDGESGTNSGSQVVSMSTSPRSARLTTTRRRWEGVAVTQTVRETLAPCGDPKATFGTGLVCGAVQHGKTMH